jgi:2-hydroxychromene-2-carboxylate isomerase
MSPYSWFAAERIGSLLPDAEWRPVFAGGVFKACGRVSCDTDVNAALRAATDEAVTLGVFGVPSVRVGDTLFWGDDRLEEAAALAAGAPRTTT